MENEDYIIIDGIQNIEKLNEQNEIQKNKRKKTFYKININRLKKI